MPFGVVKFGVKGTALIYTISHHTQPELGLYVGSTFDLQERTNCHIDRALTWKYKLYTAIRKNGGWNAWEMVVIDSLPNATEQEAFMLERAHYDRLGATLNGPRPYVSREEALADKREQWRKTDGQEWECVPCRTTMCLGSKRAHLLTKKHADMCQPVQAPPPNTHQTCNLCKCSFKAGYASLFYHKRTAKHIAAVAAAAAL
jgi:hypothetical protein